jgi:hypothetical protein
MAEGQVWISGVTVPESQARVSIFERATEAFITGTSNGMLPVRTVDERRIGSAIPGPVQEHIWTEWDTFVGLDTRDRATRFLNSAVSRTVSAGALTASLPTT